MSDGDGGGGTFMVMVSGQIVCLDDLLATAGSRWHCKYEFAHGPDWRCVGGATAGLSHVMHVTQNGERIVLNVPVEVTYRASNLHGWPQIVVSVYRDMQLAGYGRLHVPLQAGAHQCSTYLSKPIPTSLFGYIGTFFGYQPELFRPAMLTTTTGPNVVRMISCGQAQLSLNVVTQNLAAMGYDVGPSGDEYARGL